LYKEHPAFKAASQNAKLWRYFDLAKFLSLITTKTLYFSSVAHLREMDALEGYWSAYDFHILFPEADHNEAVELADKMARIAFVNCWHLNDYQSVAMWRIYGEQIAVQTTFGRLTDAFPCDSVHAGMVRYIDYPTELIHLPGESGAFRLAMTKDRSYEHEKELRVALVDFPRKPEITEEMLNSPDYLERFFAGYDAPAGISVSVDVDKLIEKVYLSPKLLAWHKALIEQLLKTYGFSHIPVEKSRVGQIPD
jgi:hypothetical protein